MEQPHRTGATAGSGQRRQRFGREQGDGFSEGLFQVESNPEAELALLFMPADQEGVEYPPADTAVKRQATGQHGRAGIAVRRDGQTKGLRNAWLWSWSGRRSNRETVRRLRSTRRNGRRSSCPTDLGRVDAGACSSICNVDDATAAPQFEGLHEFRQRLTAAIHQPPARPDLAADGIGSAAPPATRPPCASNLREGPGRRRSTRACGRPVSARADWCGRDNHESPLKIRSSDPHGLRETRSAAHVRRPRRGGVLLCHRGATRVGADSRQSHRGHIGDKALAQ